MPLVRYKQYSDAYSSTDVTQGADVYITVRESKKTKGEEIVQSILSTSPGTGKLELVFLDLSSFASIRAAASNFLARSPSLNVLICNAGVMMCPESATAEGFEMQMGTNHLGHFLLFDLLKERLLASATAEYSSRVVVVSSAGHMFSPIHFEDLDLKKQGYNPMIVSCEMFSPQSVIADEHVNRGTANPRPQTYTWQPRLSATMAAKTCTQPQCIPVSSWRLISHDTRQPTVWMRTLTWRDCYDWRNRPNKDVPHRSGPRPPRFSTLEVGHI
jgi:NAD(P)-dependent dehydrogenase (short-subunit alcohol dehydrogenase family)